MDMAMPIIFGSGLNLMWGDDCKLNCEHHDVFSGSVLKLNLSI